MGKIPYAIPDIPKRATDNFAMSVAFFKMFILNKSDGLRYTVRRFLKMFDQIFLSNSDGHKAVAHILDKNN